MTVIGKQVRSRLDVLAVHAAGFRQAMDGIFTQGFEIHEEWLKYFWMILHFASQLYVVYVLLTPELNQLEVPDEAPQPPFLDESGAQEEISLRKRYASALRAMPYWRELNPNPPFSEITGLLKADDFIQTLVFHLPEAYMESMRVERWAKELSAASAATQLGSLIVGLEHMSRNHLLFALPALQFAADETSWDIQNDV